jgi:hypothetical protein
MFSQWPGWLLGQMTKLSMEMSYNPSSSWNHSLRRRQNALPSAEKRMLVRAAHTARTPQQRRAQSHPAPRDR